MVAPHKICPKCQSPAPLDATFCGQCGRQYRTQFAPTGVALSTAPSPNPVFPANAPLSASEVPAPLTQSGRGLSFAIAGMAIAVAILILVVVHQKRPEIAVESSSHVTQASGALAPPFPPTSSPKAPSFDSNPLADAAKGGVEGADPNTPSASAVGPDGRIHLRNGGSITREEWETAAKKVNNNPVVHAPIVPPDP